MTENMLQKEHEQKMAEHGLRAGGPQGEYNSLKELYESGIKQENDLVYRHRKLAQEMSDTVARKNADYSGADSDGFKNFKLVEQLGICSAEVGFLVRMCDKLARLSTLVGSETEPQVADESINDTLGDLANYAMLMRIYRDSNSDQ